MTMPSFLLVSPVICFIAWYQLALGQFSPPSPYTDLPEPSSQHFVFPDLLERGLEGPCVETSSTFPFAIVSDDLLSPLRSSSAYSVQRGDSWGCLDGQGAGD